VVGATRLVAGVSSIAPDASVHCPSELSVTTGAYAPGQVLHFGSLAYIADCHDELHLLHGATPAGDGPRRRPLRQDPQE
jgi:hypothetical protein